jgi:hypothetical protein
MRVGKNPYKHKTGKFTPAKVGIVSLTYIPFLDGYFQNSLEVLKIHLESLLLTKTEDCNLLVFDNGSCQEVTEFLQAEQLRGSIDWLVLSNHNLSKVGAINWAFSVLENEYLAYTDSDILFRPGWVEKSLAIFDQYEQAGIVAVQPPFFDLLKEEFLSLQNIQADDRFQVEEAQPEPRWIEEYCRGVGLPEEKWAHYQEKRLFRVSAKTGGIPAWIGATHAQFMVRQELGKSMLPLPVTGRLMPGDAREINRKPEELGFWQLSTIDSYFYHIGNSLNQQVLQEIALLRKEKSPQAGDGQMQRSSETGRGLKGGIIKLLAWLMEKIPWLRKIFTRLYGFLFKLVEDY